VGFADVAAANPFRLPRLHPGIAASGCGAGAGDPLHDNNASRRSVRKPDVRPVWAYVPSASRSAVPPAVALALGATA
jgi:hypothetical protein